jgi:Ca-activated chloride channel homolog
MENANNFYAILGLPHDATLEEIKRAYRKAARRLHPDTNPAPGAVELFINIQQAYETLSNVSLRSTYDAELPAEIKNFNRISANIEYSQPFIKSQVEKQLLYILLELQASSDEKEQPSVPVNICLVIDTSTSMKGNAIDNIKEAALDLINQLRPFDYLSIVSFNDKAEVLLSSTSSINRIRAEKAVRMLRTGGGTEIGKGLEAGFNEVLKHSKIETISHIILMTDGRTYGDEEACFRIAEGATLEGIVINGVGIGSRWNDVFLDTLASMTGGACIYLEDIGEIHRFLIDKFNVLTRRYAERVILDLEFGNGIHLLNGMRIQPEAAPILIETPYILGSLPYNSPLSLLLEFQVEDVAPVQQFLIAKGFLSYEIPSLPDPMYTTRISFQLPVKDSLGCRPSEKVLEAISLMTFYRMQEKAKLDLEQGDTARAVLRLEKLATRLLTSGKHRLAATILQEAENIQNKKAMSEEGKKRIKYGTRALLLPDSFIDEKERSFKQSNRINLDDL